MRVLINILQKCPFPPSQSGVLCRLSCGPPFAYSPPAKRLYSSVCVDETVTIPVGNNGRVSLGITRPRESLNDDRASVVLSLPPGPLFPPHRLESHCESNLAGNGDDTATSLSRMSHGNHSSQHALASATNSTVVTLNYRLGTDSAINTPSPGPNHSGYGGQQEELVQEKGAPFYKYPTPVHDTLAGFDWILQNLQPAKLNVLGTHIGGSLALMLALTESKSLHAVAALEPVCDWVELDEYCTILPDNESEAELARPPRRSSGRRSMAPPDLVPLLQARKSFFQTPERYFDGFASPILFLRSAGSYVPRKFPEYLTGPEYPIPVLKKPTKEDEDKLDSWDMYTPLYSEEAPPTPSDSESASDLLTDPADIHKGVRRRKSLSRWPPFGLDYRSSSSGKGLGHLEMTLPWVRVFIREEADERPTVTHDRRRYARRFPPRRVLESQAGEMVSVMRRACFWGRETGFAEERVTLASTRSEKWVRDAGEWLERLAETPSDDSGN